MAPTAQDLIRVAEADIGYLETPANSNKTKFGAWYGLNGQPYCAMAVSYWCHRAGYPLRIETSRGFAWTVAGVRYFKANNLWVPDRHRGQPGDLIFFNFDSDAGPEHVGLAVRVLSAGRYETIEANTSPGAGGSQANGGGVYRRVRASNILGFGRLHLAKPVPAKRWQDDGYAHPMLRRGDSGKAVKHLQDRLLHRGINTVIDGDFGPATEANVKRWQNFRLGRNHADGIVGPNTWASLH